MSKKPSEIVKELWAREMKFLCILGKTDDLGVLTKRWLVLGSITLIFAIGMTLNSLIGSDIEDALRSLLIMPMVFHELSKCYALYFSDALNAYFSQTTKINEFFEKSEKNLKFREIKFVLNYLKERKLWTYLYFIIFFLIAHFPIMFAWITSLYQKDFVYMASINLPFTDPQKLSGFLINQFAFLGLTLMNFIAATSIDFAILVLFDMTVPMADIYILKLRKVGSELEKLNLRQIPKEDESNLMKLISFEQKILNDKLELERHFIELIKEFQVYSAYIENLYYAEAYIFSVISINSLSIGLGIFSTFISESTYSSIIATAFFIGYASQLGFICIEGAIIINQKDKILKGLCDFPWYEMSPKMRIIYLQFVHCCQYSPEIELPFFGVLDMEIFTTVINGSYSLYNFFLNFVRN